MNLPEIDKRLAKWPLMENANKTHLIVMVYLIFIKIIGPAWMKNRKPFNLRLPMILYNFAMVFFSSWMFYKFGKHGWFTKYSWKCQPVDYHSEDEDAMGMVEVCWYFFISKIIELADTVFFVLRKKYSQISVLHVIHHAVVPLASRFCISRGATGYNSFFGFVNSFVHIWMYLYYALAAIGPSTQKYLWWKKYMTILQLIQFCIVFIIFTEHSLNPKCEVNAILVMISLGHALFFFILFIHFYTTVYKNKHKKGLASSNGFPEEGEVTQFDNSSNSHIKLRSHIKTTNDDSAM